VTEPTEVTAVPQVLLRARGVAKALDIGETKAWYLIASGALPSVKIGRSTRVSVDVVKAYVQKLQDEQDHK